MGRLRYLSQNFVGLIAFTIVAVQAVAIVLSETNSPPVTFYKDIQPILQQHCQTCHRSGEIAPMPLVGFDDARKYAAKMKQITRAKMMP